ncbi:MAG: SGNH/GDSL hydrolase family protein [Pyrinomonadaceae bacterium]
MARVFASSILLLTCTVFVTAQSTASEMPDCAVVKAQASRMETRLKDWPSLARYRNDNLKVAPAPKDKKRVVFMGDSITDWWAKQESGGFFPGRPYINRGIAGQTTPQMLVRFRPDVIALKPHVVVILAGTNDLAVGNDLALPDLTLLKSIQDNLISMVELARANGMRVVLASVLPVSDYGKEKDGKPVNQTARRRPDQIRALNDWIKTYAAETGLTYLDYHSAMVDEKGLLQAELSDDGLHPNHKGYAVMAPLAERAVAEAYKRKK